MANALVCYFEALDRLVKKSPLHISADFRINNDTVAIEAGRTKGSIKSSRPVFNLLIKEIKKAEEQRKMLENVEVTILQSKLAEARASAANFRDAWEQSISRELCLLNELHALKSKLGDLR